MTMQSFSDVFPPNVLTYVSDRSVDHTLTPEQTQLNDKQKSALSKDLNADISDVFNIRQVHEDNIIVATKKNNVIRDADGLITNDKDLAIAIRTADCLSVFLYDPKNQAIGLIHCGWMPTRLGILAKTLDLMKQKYSTNPAEVIAAFGPGIRDCHYEVGKEFIDFFPEDVDKKDGKYFVDLADINRKQLLRRGVKDKNIHDCKVCTFCDSGCFSYRREGEKAGRMLSLMMIKS